MIKQVLIRLLVFVTVGSQLAINDYHRPVRKNIVRGLLVRKEPHTSCLPRFIEDALSETTPETPTSNPAAIDHYSTPKGYGSKI